LQNTVHSSDLGEFMPYKTPVKKKASGLALPRWALWSGLALALIIIVSVVYLVTRRGRAASVEATPTEALSAEMSVDDAFFLFGEKSVLFVDVRPAYAWKAFHIDQSVSIPEEELSQHLDEIPKTDTVIIVDELGGEPAQRTSAILKQAGYHKVTMMLGGIQAWVQKRYPLIGTAPY
jgi:rhodanese-related sulfurtransferase